MRKLNVAILGQGRSGRDIHGKYLLTRPDKYNVVFVADPISQRRERAEREYGCRAYESYTELFGRDDVDFVINATPSHLHVPITIDLLNHGFNVLCEKPFAHTAEQVDEMIAAAQKAGRMLAVFQQSRFAPYFETIRGVLRSGVLGNLIQVSIRFNGFARRWDWQCCQDMGGGNLFNTGPHPMDQALQILDYPDMPNVFCKMNRVNTFGDAEDYAKIILTAPDRPLIDLEISSCDAYSPFVYSVMGTNGSLKGNFNDVEWRWFDPVEAPDQHLIREPLHDEDWLPLYCVEKLNWHTDRWKVEDDGIFSRAVGKLYDSVSDHLTEGKPLLVTPMQVRQQILVMQECHRQNPLSQMDWKGAAT